MASVEQVQNMIDAAKAEWLTAMVKMTETVNDHKIAFNDFKTVMGNMALMSTKESREKGGQCGGGSFLPTKDSKPNVLKDELEKWRDWKEDTVQFADDQRRGIKVILEWIEEKEELSMHWKDIITNDKPFGFKAELLDEDVNLWRYLKGITAGDARDTVKSVGDEDGFRAWHELHKYFMPQLEARQSEVITDFSEMVKKPAQDISEMRKLLTEMQKKMTDVEKITGERVQEAHAKSILISILDKTTRQHTAQYQGLGFDKLKKEILKFVNTAVGPTASGENGQIGSMQGQGECPRADVPSWGTEEPEQLGALGGGRCHNCNMPGHFARNCPKGGGKGQRFSPYGKAGWKGGGVDGGKGGWKGGGANGGYKGKGKGPKDGCYICGGEHYQSDCPKGGEMGQRKRNQSNWRKVARHQQRGLRKARCEKPVCRQRVQR